MRLLSTVTGNRKLDEALEKVAWVTLVLGAIAGLVFGFRVGGIGGAIIFAPLGALLGGVLPEVMGWVFAVALLALQLGAIVGGIALAGWALYLLWGVGR